MHGIENVVFANMGLIIASIGSILGIVILAVLARYFVTLRDYEKAQKMVTEDIDKLTGKVENQVIRTTVLEGEVLRMETSLQNLPQKDDFKTLDLKLFEMNGRISEMTAGLTGLKEVIQKQDTQLTMVHEHLLALERNR